MSTSHEKLNSELNSGLNPLYEAWRTQTTRVSPEGARFAFDCDQTLIRGDIGEATYRLALSRRAIISHDAWWRHLEEGEIGSALERAAWRASYERASHVEMTESMAQSTRSEQSSEQSSDQSLELDPLSAELWEAYQRLCRVDVRSGYVYAARLVYQRTRSEVAALTADAFGRDPAVSERSLMREFVTTLQARSGEVWVVSSSQAEIVSVIARRYQIPIGRVVGIDFKRDAEGRYTDQLCDPAPIDERKVDALHSALSDASAPLELMAGDSRYDLPMMRWAQVGILIDHGRSAELTQAAQSLGGVIVDAQLLDH